MAINLSDAEGRRYAACHEFRRATPGPAKREKGKRTVVFRPLLCCIEICFCCLVSAVTYSPTTSRLQYHQRVQV